MLMSDGFVFVCCCCVIRLSLKPPKDVTAVTVKSGVFHSPCCSVNWLDLKDVRLRFFLLCFVASPSRVCTRNISRLVPLIAIKIIQIFISSSSWSVLLLVHPRWKPFFLRSQWITSIWQEGGLYSPSPKLLPLFSHDGATTVSPRQNKSSVLAANQNSSDNSTKKNKDVTRLFLFAGKKSKTRKKNTC